MKPKITVSTVDSIKELICPGSNKIIVEQETFYIYKKINGGLHLYIADGIKTCPPLSPLLAEHDPKEYSKVFTVPKGIIKSFMNSWINPDTCGKLLNDGQYLVLKDRNDEYAIELFENYFWRC